MPAIQTLKFTMNREELLAKHNCNQRCQTRRNREQNLIRKVIGVGMWQRQVCTEYQTDGTSALKEQDEDDPQGRGQENPIRPL